MSKVLIFLVSFFLISQHFIQAIAHPFYVSIVQLDHNLSTKSLEATFKIFTDDLEGAILHENYPDPKLGTRNQAKDADSTLYSFILKHFSITVNGKSTENVFIGMEPEFDVTRIYIEFLNVPDEIYEILVETDLLVEVLADQSNIIHYQKNKEIESLILNREKQSGKIVPK